MSDTSKETQQVLDEERAIQELSIGHQCLIELRCLLKRENWSKYSCKQRIDILSGRALHGLQAGLSFLTSACSSKIFGAGTSDPVPSADPTDPTLSADFSGKRAKSLPTGGDINSKLRSKRAMTSTSVDINAREKKKRRSSTDLDSWTKTANPDHDRHLWAKYGQKPIKDSRHPRSYYKCKRIGCAAMKKVQKCDTSNTTMYYIAYSGEHTCKIAASISPLSSPLAIPPPQIQQKETSKDLQADELLELFLSHENDCINNHNVSAPPLPEKTASPTFNFSSVSGSCPSKNLDEDHFFGELSSHPSLSSGPSTNFHHDGLGEFNSYPSFSDWSSST